MKRLLILLLSAPCIAAGQAAEIKLDKYTGSKTASFKSASALMTMSQGAPHERHYFAVRSVTPEKPDVNSIFLIFKSQTWRYLKCSNVDWLIDGKPIKFKEIIQDRNVQRGTVTEGFILQSDRSQMASIAKAGLVEIRVCNDEYVLSKEAIQGTGDVVLADLSQKP